MPKQEFEFVDYLGALAVSVCFIIILFILSLVINFLWITKADDRTVFEKVTFEQKISSLLLTFLQVSTGNLYYLICLVIKIQ